MKFELFALNVHLNVICSKVSCPLGICSQLVRSLVFFFSEILFQFIPGYTLLKLTPLSVGNTKAEGMHYIFSRETSKNFRTWPRNCSASYGLMGKKCMNAMRRFSSLFEVIFFLTRNTFVINTYVIIPVA